MPIFGHKKRRTELRAVSNETETHSCPYIELKLYNETLRNMYNMSGFRNGFRFHLKTLPKRNPQQRILSFFTVFSCFVGLRVSFWVSFSFLRKRSGCATLYKVHRVSFRDASRVATRTALLETHSFTLGMRSHSFFIHVKIKTLVRVVFPMVYTVGDCNNECAAAVPE